MSGHVTYRGKIRYLHDVDGENGREWFTITGFRGAERTIRAMCEMDNMNLLRDVTLTVGDDFSPKDCYNRLTMNDDFMGSSWFRFQDRHVECEGFIGNAGRISQRVELEHKTPVFACHPLYVDGWHAAAYDHTNPVRVQILENCTNSSMKLDGSTAPMIGVVRKGLEYVGPEVLEIEAGTFEAQHYRIIPMRTEEPNWTPLDLWVHGPELLFLQLRWDMMETTYQLAEIEAPNWVAQPLSKSAAA